MARSRAHQFGQPDVGTYMGPCARGDHDECPGSVPCPNFGPSAIVVCRCGCHRFDFTPWPWPSGD